MQGNRDTNADYADSSANQRGSSSFVRAILGVFCLVRFQTQLKTELNWTGNWKLETGKDGMTTDTT